MTTYPTWQTRQPEAACECLSVPDLQLLDRALLFYAVVSRRRHRPRIKVWRAVLAAELAKRLGAGR